MFKTIQEYREFVEIALILLNAYGIVLPKRDSIPSLVREDTEIDKELKKMMELIK